MDLPLKMQIIISLSSIILGLFLWLGGSRYSRLVAGLLGAVLGGLAGIMVSQWFGLQSILSIAVGGAVGSLLAVFLHRIVIFLLAIIIFALVGGSGYLGHAVNTPLWHDTLEQTREKVNDFSSKTLNTESLSYAERNYLGWLAKQQNQADTLDHREQSPSTDKLKSVWAELRYLMETHSTMLIVYALLGAAVGWLLARLLKIFVMALCCSIVGTTATIAGVMLLLLGKQINLLYVLQSRPRVLPIIFISMIIFGWLTQLVLARPSKKKIKENEDGD